MKKFYVLILILFSNMLAFGQAYHPIIRPGITWDIVNMDYHLQYCYASGGYRFYILGDSTIAGKTYKEVGATPLYSLNTDPWPNFFCPPYAVAYGDTLNESSSYDCQLIREDTLTRKVYTYDNTVGDTLLYDFNLTTGDTLRSCGYGGPYSAVVDSVRTVFLLDGSPRKMFYLEVIGNWEYVYYIESIGGSQGTQFQIHNPFDGFGYEADPICFSENGIPLWGTRCNYIQGVEQAENEHFLRLFPNPANTYLELERSGSESMQFYIYDLMGRVVLGKNIQTTKEKILLENLSPGCYIYEALTDTQRTSGKLIIAR